MEPYYILFDEGAKGLKEDGLVIDKDYHGVQQELHNPSSYSKMLKPKKDFMIKDGNIVFTPCQYTW